MPDVEMTITMPKFKIPDIMPVLEGFAESAREATKALRQFSDACYGIRRSALGLYDLSRHRGPPLRVKLARKVLRHPERYDERMVERARHTAMRIHNRMMIRLFKSSSEYQQRLLLFGGACLAVPVFDTRKSRRWPL